MLTTSKPPPAPQIALRCTWKHLEACFCCDFIFSLSRNMVFVTVQTKEQKGKEKGVRLEESMEGRQVVVLDSATQKWWCSVIPMGFKPKNSHRMI